MKELYSNADDCYKLARLLDSKLKGKIEFSGSIFQELVIGKYHSLPYNEYENYIDYRNDTVEFRYKFLENGFLRISVCDIAYKKASMGHKLAVLSDLYQVISKKYGEPSVYFTLKEDDENSINLDWNFIQKEETVEAYKNGTMFDDSSIKDIIIIGEEKDNTSSYSLTNRTKELISKTIGIPYGLIYLVDENIEDYILYKKGERISYPKEAKVDGYPIKTMESIDDEISKKLIKK